MRQEQLGPYRIVRLIGRGGMGAVYEAVDPTTGQEVAVKTLASHVADDSGLRRRFFAEIETLKGLVHPGIVRLLAFGEQDGMPYFAMELVRGRSLEEQLKREGTFDWKRTVEIAMAVSRTLKVAHDHGVVHRDLKPANILLGDDGSIKLADFGIAKLFGNVSLTAHGSVVGTAEYMAPEQAAGRPTDHRVDLYGLGASMFSMLAGHPPFRGASMVEVLEKHQRSPAPRVGTVAAGVPPELDELIDRLLAKEPSRRPATAHVLVRLLESVDTAAGGDTDAASSDGVASDDTRPNGTVVLVSGGTAASGSAPTKPEGDRRAVDLLAATLGPSTEVASAPAAQPTLGDANQPQAGTTQVDATRQTRFTTVENLVRAEEEQRRRTERSQSVLRGIATLAMLGAAAAAVYGLLRPPTVDESYARIMKVVDGDGDLRDAEPAITRFLARHGDDPRAGQVRGFAERLSIDDLERDLRRPNRRTGEEMNAAQRDYLIAMERAGKSASGGLAALEAWLVLHADGGTWQGLVERQIERLRPAADTERAEDARRLAAALGEAAALDEAAAKESDPARASELRSRRSAILKGIIELFSERSHARDAVRQAVRLLEEDDSTETFPVTSPRETP